MEIERKFLLDGFPEGLPSSTNASWNRATCAPIRGTDPLKGEKREARPTASASRERDGSCGRKRKWI